MKILYPPFKKTNRTVQHTFYSPYGRTLQLTACSQCVVCSLGGYPPPPRIGRNRAKCAAISRNCTEVVGMVSCGCCRVQV